MRNNGYITHTQMSHMKSKGHLPGLIKPTHGAVAQTEHHGKERIEILLLF